MCSSGDAMNGSGGAGAGGEAGAAAAGDGGSASGARGVEDDTRVLRLPVAIKAGEAVKVLIRSAKLGVEEFSDVIRATQLAGVKVRREEAKE